MPREYTRFYVKVYAWRAAIYARRVCFAALALYVVARLAINYRFKKLDERENKARTNPTQALSPAAPVKEATEKAENTREPVTQAAEREPKRE